MNSFVGDEDDADSGALSPNGSSDNDAEAELDGEGDVEGDTYGDAENEDENDDNDDPYDEQEQDDSQDQFGDTPTLGQVKHGPTSIKSFGTSADTSARDGPSLPTTAPVPGLNPTVLLTSPSPAQTPSASNGFAVPSFQIRPEALTASVYDIVPTIAAPHSTSINSITATPDLRWVFSGGADGYIRKFNWIDTVNAKATTGEEGPYLSSVYSLAVQRDGLWLLSGLENGGINLQSVRHDEGKQIACLRQHTSAISVLNLASDERSLLSGSWDKSVIDWDLNTGQAKRKFEGSGGQISALEIRPTSNLPVPEVTGDILPSSSTFSSDGADKPLPNGRLTNGLIPEDKMEPTDENTLLDAPGSPTDSLFGGSLFEDDDENEFSRAIANGVSEQDHMGAEKDVDMLDSAPTAEPLMNGNMDVAINGDDGIPANVHESTSSAINGLPHAEAEDEISAVSNTGELAVSTDTETTARTDTTFLAATFDGSLRVWDKRRASPIARIPPRNVPPWCMNACWSPDGNFIYAGRRNGTVEEFSLHKGLREVERSFKLPHGSGPVSAVRAMPNGRHLIWYSESHVDLILKLTGDSASYDILRLYDLEQQQTFKHSTVPFLIVPGHRTGVVSHLYIDPTCRYMISTAGNRGYQLPYSLTASLIDAASCTLFACSAGFLAGPTIVISDRPLEFSYKSSIMPQLRDVTVHVTDVDGNPFEEWGVQSLRGNKISTYIESTTDVPFRISVQPRIPYLDYEPPSGDNFQRLRSRGSDGVRIKMEDSEDDLAGNPSSSRWTYSRRDSLYDGNTYRPQRRPYDTEQPSSSNEIHGRSSYEDYHPPFTFIATLYLDGRKKPERRIVIYLDPNDEDFNQPFGKVSFKSRCVQGRDGLMREQAWVFKDIGIETMFDKIALRDGPRNKLEFEDIIVDAMENSRLGGGHVGTCEEDRKVGQIVVELERVVLGRKYRERNHRPRHYEDDQYDVIMEGVDHDVVHKTDFEHLRSLDYESVPCVRYKPYVEGERPWATFQFFYRSHKQLQKFSFPGYPQNDDPKLFRERQLLDKTLAMLTPLSIAHGKNTAPVDDKGKEPSFETREDQGTLSTAHRPKPRYQFHDHRDPLKYISGRAQGNPQQLASHHPKQPVSTQPIYVTDSDRGSCSAVVAVKERKTSHSSHTKFAIGACSARARKSHSSSSSLSSPPASLSDDASVQPPANSPTKGFNNIFADARRSAPKGSDFDTFKTLASASLALTKAKTSTANGQLTPKSTIKNSSIYRGADYSSDADADTDDEKDGKSEEGSWESDDGDDDQGSDKENMPSAENDDAGLHEDFFKVSIGTKRQRGEGMEDLEEGEIDEGDGAITGNKNESEKKKSPPARVLICVRPATPEKEPEGDKQMVARSGNAVEEQQSKRVKLRQDEVKDVEGESSRETRGLEPQGELVAEEQEKTTGPVMEQMAGLDD
ncbi:MAG: hypothetical protein Q9200_000108 [Gallowayella weberi]